MIDDDDFFEIFREPIYFDSQEELTRLKHEVSKIDDVSLIDEVGEINREIFDSKLKDILFEYNQFAVNDEYCNYVLEDDKRKYLENLYINYYTEIYLDEDGRFIYDPRE